VLLFNVVRLSQLLHASPDPLSRIVLGVLTDPLPSNRSPIVARVGFRENVFTESLPSNGSTRHNMSNLKETYTPGVLRFYTHEL
jgi:hypothetical protein